MQYAMLLRGETQEKLSCMCPSVIFCVSSLYWTCKRLILSLTFALYYVMFIPNESTLDFKV